MPSYCAFLVVIETNFWFHQIVVYFYIQWFHIYMYIYIYWRSFLLGFTMDGDCIHSYMGVECGLRIFWWRTLMIGNYFIPPSPRCQHQHRFGRIHMFDILFQSLMSLPLFFTVFFTISICWYIFLQVDATINFSLCKNWFFWKWNRHQCSTYRKIIIALELYILYIWGLPKDGYKGLYHVPGCFFAPLNISLLTSCIRRMTSKEMCGIKDWFEIKIDRIIGCKQDSLYVHIPTKSP